MQSEQSPRATYREVAGEMAALLEQSRQLGSRVEQIAAMIPVQPEGRCAHLRSLDRLDRARWLYRAMEIREAAFGKIGSLFGDPGFEILLLVYIRTLEERLTSVSACTNVGNTASTTGLRWLNTLLQRGMVERVEDPKDRRRGLVTISSEGRAVMERYLDTLDL